LLKICLSQFAGIIPGKGSHTGVESVVVQIKLSQLVLRVEFQGLLIMTDAFVVLFLHKTGITQPLLQVFKIDAFFLGLFAQD
jgi:hypothetical protein